LDEPTNGLDPHGIIEIRNLIRDLPTRENVSIFVSSHMLNEVQLIATYAGLLHHGRMLAQAPLADLLTMSDAELDVAVNDAPRAAETLHAHRFRTHIVNHGALIVFGLAGDARRAAEVNRILIEAGFTVSAIGFRPVTLEDLFLKLTGEARLAA
jgi:ABC-2 type transport system ATP-binding protein